MSCQHERSVADWAVDYVWFIGAEGFEAVRGWAVDTLVELSVGITQFNSDVSQFLSEKSHSLQHR